MRDGMRVVSAVVLILALLGAAQVRAANPYEIFRLGMSVAEFKQAMKENGGEVHDAVEEAEERGEPLEDTGPYGFFWGVFPTDEKPYGIFFFKDEKLRTATLEYEFLPHTTQDGWKTAAECETRFAHIGKQIEAVYGPSTGIVDTDETPNRSVTRLWHLPDATVDFYMFIDGMAGRTTPGDNSGALYCGSLHASLFDGNEKERGSFIAEMEAFFGSQQDRR
ncbi:MAG: hypothetical protein KF765_07485 [Parvibaculaceae bacterium]|nr:hypothetical protein [Parvibaculaceae bacterium]